MGAVNHCFSHALDITADTYAFDGDNQGHQTQECGQFKPVAILSPGTRIEKRKADGQQAEHPQQPFPSDGGE